MSGFRVNLNDGWLTPIHRSREYGIHANINPYNGGDTIHIPYNGQTTLDMYSIGGRPNYNTYNVISQNNLGK